MDPPQERKRHATKKVYKSQAQEMQNALQKRMAEVEQLRLRGRSCEPYGEGDVVVHREFGICDVVEVRRLGRLIRIQRHTNKDRHWVDLDEDPGAFMSTVQCFEKYFAETEQTDQNGSATRVWAH